MDGVFCAFASTIYAIALQHVMYKLTRQNIYSRLN